MSPGIVTLHEAELRDYFPQDFIGRGGLGEPKEARDRILILEFRAISTTMRVAIAITWYLLWEADHWLDWNLNPVRLEKFMWRDDMILARWYGLWWQVLVSLCLLYHLIGFLLLKFESFIILDVCVSSFESCIFLGRFDILHFMVIQCRNYVDI